MIGIEVSQRIRVFPTSDQEEVLWKLSEKCRLLYNFALEERINTWKNGVKGINYYKQQNDLPELKEKFPEYKWVYSKVLQYVLRILDANYKSFFALWKRGSKKARPPKFKGKKYFTTMVYNQSGFKIGNRFIKISHKYNNVPLLLEIPEKFQFENVKQVSISQDNLSKEYYVSICYEIDDKDYVDNGMYQAIDLGITNIVTAVNMEGKFIQIKNKRPDKYWEKKVEDVQSKRDRCKRLSKRWYKYNEQLKHMKRKCANQIKDFQHKLSKKIVENTKANTIIVGELDVKEMASRKKGRANHKGKRSLNRAIQNTGTLGRFVQFLTYKAERVGKRIIRISECNTSKMCCVCGRIHDMPLWVREMNCDCGNEIDLDKNSCVNMMKRFLSQNAKWTGYQEFLGNLRHTANGKTRAPSPIFGYSSEDSQEAHEFIRG